MKKTLLIMSMITAGAFSSFAQCIPDSNLPTGGTEFALLPDTSITITQTPSGTVDFTLSIFAPSAFSMTMPGVPIPITGTIDSVRVDEATGIPGLSLICPPEGCWVMANQPACFKVTGKMPATDNIAYELALIMSPYGELDPSLVALGASLPTPIVIDPKIEANADHLPLATYDFVVGTPTGIEDFDLSGSFTVAGNYPNPFDNTTNITFNTTVSGNVSFVVVDILGRQVYDTNITATAGSNTFTYSTDLASGTYFFSLSDGTDTVTRKIVVSRN